MDGKLFTQAIVKFFTGLVLVGVLVFVPAGTFLFGRDGCYLEYFLFQCL